MLIMKWESWISTCLITGQERSWRNTDGCELSGKMRKNEETGNRNERGQSPDKPEVIGALKGMTPIVPIALLSSDLNYTF